VTGVGKYRYIAMLAEGGMADVYLAVTKGTSFEKLVVIKQLRESLAEDPSFVAMFMDEARLAARLNHPNVVQTLEVGRDESGRHFIAMEFLEGVTYTKLARIKERIPPPLAFHLRIIVEVLRGLHYAHELRDFDGKPLNVVHRDISPQNVMLNFAGGVKLLDFGIAKAALAVEQRPEDFKGKLEYMAPEQALLEDVDRRADIFSVGVMLWEALTRRRLYEKGEDKFEKLTTGEIPDVLAIRPDASKRLAAICKRALAHDRNARYATADAMADDIEDWLGSTTQYVTSRDVGSYLADKFSTTRTKINEAIEEQLKKFKAQSDSSPETIPISKLPFGETTTDLSDPPPAPHGYAATVPPGAMPPLNLPPIAPAANGSTQNVWTSEKPPVEGAQGVSVPPHVSTASPKRGQQQKSLIVLAIVGALGLVLLLGGIGIASIAKKKSATTVASASSAGALATTNGETIAEIDFTVKASPPSAVISVDGRIESGNPVSGKRTRDGAIHQVHVEAPGYEPRDETISFDRSFLVTIELKPADPPPVILSGPVPTTTGKGGRWWTRGQNASGGTAKNNNTGKAQGKGGGGLDTDNPYQ
jgi:eukaryotic-like serine/threonine-protein kinase